VGRTFESFAAIEAHLVQWALEIADLQVRGTTGEAPGLRFARDEASHLKALAHCGSLVATRELSRCGAPTARWRWT
jgi:hypothetical protein